MTNKECIEFLAEMTDGSVDEWELIDRREDVDIGDAFAIPVIWITLKNTITGRTTIVVDTPSGEEEDFQHTLLMYRGEVCQMVAPRSLVNYFTSN